MIHLVSFLALYSSQLCYLLIIMLKWPYPTACPGRHPSISLCFLLPSVIMVPLVCPSSAHLVHHNQPTEPLSLPTHLRGVYVPRSSIYSLPDFSLNHSGNKLKAYITSIDFPVLVLVISNLSLMLQDPHLPLWCFHAHLQTTLSFHSLKWGFFFYLTPHPHHLQPL